MPQSVPIVLVSEMSNPAEWMPFLQRYATAFGTEEWPGSPAVSDDQLLAVEKWLKIRLPPSYRAFLSVSNGWRQASRAVPMLRPVEAIRWFRKEHRDWVQAYTDPMQGVGNIAGRLIADFQEPGFLALEPLINHPDVEIR